MTSDKHNWTKEERMMVCRILKEMKFRYPTYDTRDEYTEIGRWHSVVYKNVAAAMSIITGETFTPNQISMQMYKVNMHKQLKDGKWLTESQYEMLKCMMECDVLDRESFYNMNYGWHAKYEQIKDEEEILKLAEEILKKREEEMEKDL